MFIGNSNLDHSFLRRNFKNPDKIREYSKSLIPKEFSHIKELQDNQLYYVILSMRKIGIKDYKALRESISKLLKGVRVTGYVDDIIDISYLYNITNKNKVDLYLERL